MKKLLFIIATCFISLPSHGHEIEINTNVDSNYMTSCDENHVMVGISGGYGHSSNHNSPHKIQCSDISNFGSNTYFGAHAMTLMTATDNDILWTECPLNYAMTGVSGGYGHSSNHNKPHAIMCQRLENMNTGNGYTFHTGVDNKSITTCPIGYVVKGMIGGYGHSNKYNTPHKFSCIELR